MGLCPEAPRPPPDFPLPVVRGPGGREGDGMCANFSSNERSCSGFCRFPGRESLKEFTSVGIRNAERLR